MVPLPFTNLGIFVARPHVETSHVFNRNTLRASQNKTFRRRLLRRNSTAIVYESLTRPERLSCWKRKVLTQDQDLQISSKDSENISGSLELIVEIERNLDGEIDEFAAKN